MPKTGCFLVLTDITMAKITAPALRYIGGKWILGKWIIPFFPPHTTYCEPYGGAFSVGLQKDPVRHEIYNDTNLDAVNFWRQLKDNTQQLVEAIKAAPRTREFYELCKTGTPSSELEWAVWFYVHAKLSYTGAGGRWDGGTSEQRLARSSVHKNDHLWAIAERMADVRVWSVPALDCIDLVDGPDTLFYCLAAGTPIRLASEKFIPIEKVQEGDIVAPGRTVKSVFSREYNGSILEFSIQGMPDNLRVTPEHRIPRIPAKPQDLRQEKRSHDELWSQVEVANASEIKVGDLLLVPLGGVEEKTFLNFRDTPRLNGKRRKDVFFSDCPELYRFIGYYAAEGHLQKTNGYNTCVVLSFGTHEKDTWVKDAARCIETCFGIKPLVKPGPTPSVTQVVIYSSSIADFVSELIPGLQPRRMLSEDLMRFPVELQKEILIGWLRGDGGLEIRTRNRVRLLGTSSSEKLARQMFTIALRCRLRPSFKYRQNNHDVYFAAEDIECLGWKTPCKRFRSSRKIINNHLLVRVKSVTSKPYSGKVYDLDVDGDDLFAAPYVLVHNCDPPYLHSTRGSKDSRHKDPEDCLPRRQYRHEMTEDDHRQLLDRLLCLQGKAIISGYDSPLYEEKLENNGWRKVSKKLTTSARIQSQETLWLSPSIKY